MPTSQYRSENKQTVRETALPWLKLAGNTKLSDVITQPPASFPRPYVLLPAHHSDSGRGPERPTAKYIRRLLNDPAFNEKLGYMSRLLDDPPAGGPLPAEINKSAA